MSEPALTEAQRVELLAASERDFYDLYQLVARMMAEARAEAWDEGYEGGGEDEWAVDGEPVSNPYREADSTT